MDRFVPVPTSTSHRKEPFFFFMASAEKILPTSGRAPRRRGRGLECAGLPL